MNKILVTLLLFIFSGTLVPATLQAQSQSGDGSIGIEGQISADPPDTAATISSPAPGSVFSNTPITVTGLCPGTTLVKVFANGVFVGSAQCTSGSYSLQIDLFNGVNDLVAIVFDELDQQGPSSNTVSVSYEGAQGASPIERITLSSNFARKGENPGDTLNWPIVVSGGVGPYAVSVNWGDGEESLISVQNPG